MSRVKDEGFRYCTQDTDTFFDPKIRMLIASHGCDGYAVWDYIKLAAYREHGYYVEWDECRNELASADLGLKPTKIGLIIDYLLQRSLLSCVERKTCKSCNGVKVLTSHGIQKRFQRMARDSKRVYTVKREIWLLSEDETLDCIQCTQKTDFSGKKADNSGKKADNSRIIDTKTKQSKAKQNNDVVVVYAREDGVSLTGLVDEGMELISAAYESNIGTISPLIAEQMREYRDKMEPECIVKAISTACDNGVRTWAYIRGILNNRLAKNVTTMREWEADETEWARQKSKGEDKKGRRAKSVTEIINELED